MRGSKEIINSADPLSEKNARSLGLELETFALSVEKLCDYDGQTIFNFSIAEGDLCTNIENN